MFICFFFFDIFFQIEIIFFFSSLVPFVRIQLKRSYGFSFSLISFSSSIPQSIWLLWALPYPLLCQYFTRSHSFSTLFLILGEKYSNGKIRSLGLLITLIIIIRIHVCFWASTKISRKTYECLWLLIVIESMTISKKKKMIHWNLKKKRNGNLNRQWLRMEWEWVAPIKCKRD